MYDDIDDPKVGFYTEIKDEDHYNKVVEYYEKYGLTEGNVISYEDLMRYYPEGVSRSLHYIEGDNSAPFCDTKYYENHGYIRKDLFIDILPQELFDF